MSDFKRHLARALKDEGFARKWEEQSAERDAARKVAEMEAKQTPSGRSLQHQRKRNAQL